MSKFTTTIGAIAATMAISVSAQIVKIADIAETSVEKNAKSQILGKELIRKHIHHQATALRLPCDKMTIDKVGKIKIKRSRSAESTDVFFESFEYPEMAELWREDTADLSWLPDGWSRDSKTAASSAIDKWFAHPFERMTLTPCYEGNYVMAVLFNSEYKDEWLVSPEIEVAENQYLTFGWYTVPAYLWVIDRNHVDFENGVFTNREIAATMKVMVSVDGGAWQELKDIADNFADMDYDELSSFYPEEMMDEKISLAEFVGKKVKIGFRYVGTDGNSIFIDGVSVNNGKSIVDSQYMPPITSLYVGGAVDMEIPDLPIQLHPANTDLEWQNYSSNSGTEAKYQWSSGGELPVASSDEYSLVVNFPTPTGETGNSFDLYLPPQLTAAVEGSRSNTYMENVLLMAGGKPDDGVHNFGVLPFDLQNDGIGVHLEEAPDFGQRGIPIFGYNDATDDFWRRYTCGGAEENLPDIPYAYLSGIIAVR